MRKLSRGLLKAEILLWNMGTGLKEKWRRAAQDESGLDVIITVLGFKEYEKELTNDGKFGRVTLYDKILTCIVVPIFMIIIILNVFGFIR